MTTNALESIVESAARIAGQNNSSGLVGVEISSSLAHDLIAMSADEWRTGSKGFLSDFHIDELMGRLFKSGVSGLNGLVVKGFIITVSSNPNFSGVKLIDEDPAC